MNTRFNEDELETAEQQNINSLIMEVASDFSEKLTELECKLNGIECYVVEIEGETEVSSYTEEAQDIFNTYYDEQKTELYNLLNSQLEMIMPVMLKLFIKHIKEVHCDSYGTLEIVDNGDELDPTIDRVVKEFLKIIAK